MPGRVNLEKSVTYLSRFMTGLYTQRSPLFTPLSAMGLQIIQRQDVLWDGADMDISHSMTLIRRPGFGVYSAASLPAGDFPQKFFSFKNVAGTVRAMVETPASVSTFDAASVTQIIPKHTTAQGSTNKVMDTLYFCDGNDQDTLKWDGTALTKWGIVAPVTAPTITIEPGTLTTVNGGYQWLYVYRNANSGHISSSSPVSASTLNATNKSFNLSGESSTDSQVTNVDIYRLEDGGAYFYLLVSLANTSGVNWTYADQNPDSSLNTDLIVIPGTHSNDPPPAGSNLSVYYQNRFFIAAGPLLYFSGGPDITNGIPEESFAPANVFRLPGAITAFADTSKGLIVFTSADAYVVSGNSTVTYGIDIWQKGFGVASQNSVAQDGDLVNVYTTQGQLFQFNADGSVPLTEIGFSIQSRLAAFDSSKVFIAIHRSGSDEGLFVSDGVSTMYRYSISMQTWSCPYHPVGGCGALSSIEATTANFQLMMGQSSGANQIMSRTPTAFNDGGTLYPCSAVVGSITMASPHQVAEVESVLLDLMPRGTYPSVSVLLNEVEGTFTALPLSVPDPALLPATTSVWSRRHDLAGASSPLARTLVRHMQVRIAFPAEDTATEVLGMAIS